MTLKITIAYGDGPSLTAPLTVLGQQIEVAYCPVEGMLSDRLAPDMELANFYHLVNSMGVLIHRGASVAETALAEI